MANYWRKRQYAELSTDPNDLAKRGLVFLFNEFFAIPATSSVAFVLKTNGALVEFQFYDITSTSFPVNAELKEAPSVGTYGASVQAFNLNRNYSDAYTLSASAAASVTGGLRIASELVGSGSKAGGQIAQNKVHTLKNETLYGMVFYNTGNQTTNCHMNLGWSENEPIPYELIRNVDSGGVT